MSSKHVLFRSEAREKILRGATTLVDAVRVTLGPKSKCVLVDKKYGHPLVCNDGVTIAREVELKDPEENLGVRMIREAAERTGDAVGDGTSTATVLAHAILVDGVRNIAAGASGVDLKRGLARGLAAVVAALRAMSRPVESRTAKAQVATISAHNDPDIGNLVADAFEKVGKEGVVSVEEAKGTETTLEVVEGMQFDRGFLSPYFVTDPDKVEAVLDDPLILLLERRLTNLKDIVPLLEEAAKADKPLLVVAEDVDREALATLVVNKLRGVIRCAAVKAPGYGDRRKAIMEDLALLTKGKFFAEELGVDLAHAPASDLGRAARVVIDRENTTVIGGAGDKAAIEGRCKELRTQIETSTSNYDKEKLRERLAKLSGGVAVIRVGAPSEAEMKNKKEALEDAISSTRAAMAEGVVPGGGLALLRAVEAVRQEEAKCMEGDERTGLRILRRALEAPARQIAENSGADPGVAVNTMLTGTGNTGFDAARGVYCDLVEAGIIDPTKVVRVALENAVSVAGTLLLTEASLTEIPEPPAEHREPAELG
jgi:chaperonin GroEL